MTAQRSSQFVNFLKIAPLHFLSLILLISQRRNGARGRAALYPTIKKSWVSHAPFRASSPGWEAGGLPPPLSCSQSFRSSISCPSSALPFFQRGRETCHGGEFLSLFGCTLSAYTNSDMTTTDDVRARIPLCNHHLCGLLGRGTAAASQLLL
jgi:hypothetical protein